MAVVFPVLGLNMDRTQYWYEIRYHRGAMESARKVTVEIPHELLDKAQWATGTGITQTVRMGLQLIAASRTYAKLQDFRGRILFTLTSADLKIDR